MSSADTVGDELASSIQSADAIEDGQPVDCYMNLNRDCLSIKSRETETYGQVVAHTDAVQIRDPEFVVQPAGRDRARDTGRRNVHAFVRGDLHSVGTKSIHDFTYLTYLIPGRVWKLTYDPFEYDEWMVVPERQRRDECLRSERQRMRKVTEISEKPIDERDEDPILALVTTDRTVALFSPE